VEFPKLVDLFVGQAPKPMLLARVNRAVVDLVRRPSDRRHAHPLRALVAQRPVAGEHLVARERQPSRPPIVFGKATDLVSVLAGAFDVAADREPQHEVAQPRRCCAADRA
jgi:hypothetical protein